MRARRSDHGNHVIFSASVPREELDDILQHRGIVAVPLRERQDDANVADAGVGLRLDGGAGSRQLAARDAVLRGRTVVSSAPVARKAGGAERRTKLTGCVMARSSVPWKAAIATSIFNGRKS